MAGGCGVAATESPLRGLTEVSPVCIRQALPVRVPGFLSRRITPPAVAVVLTGGQDEPHQLPGARAELPCLKPPPDRRLLQRYTADNAFLRSPCKGMLYRGSKNMDDVVAKPGVTWGTTILGADTGDGWLRASNGLFLPQKINGMPVLLPVEGAANGQIVSARAQLSAQLGFDKRDTFMVNVVRDERGELGFRVWPDYMTVASKDRSRPELDDLDEGDLVYAIDGFRVSTFAEYQRFARGVCAFTLTTLRIAEPCAETERDPCLNPMCCQRLCMLGAVFCPACGTRRPQVRWTP